MNSPQILISGSYNAFADGFNGAGAYLISGLIPSNTFEHPIYYGGTVNFKHRLIFEHIPQLTCNEHHNKPLQNYYNKHGLENLVFFVLETTAIEDVFTREQFYLDTERPFADEGRGFNIAKDATAPMKGRKHSEEAKRKISEAGIGRIHSEEQRKNASQRMKRVGISKETQLKMAMARSHSFSLVSPTGEIFRGKNIRLFCKEKGLKSVSISQVLNGARNSCYGWKRLEKEGK